MFTAKDVMALREMSGAGMMDCKRALVETDGDMDKAMEYLREKSLAATAKKASRIAAEGIVDSYIHMGGKIGVLLEVNCETDFVAKTDDFKQLVQTCNFLEAPFTLHFTLFTFEFQILLVFLLEWLTLLPK